MKYGGDLCTIISSINEIFSLLHSFSASPLSASLLNASRIFLSFPRSYCMKKKSHMIMAIIHGISAAKTTTGSGDVKTDANDRFIRRSPPLCVYVNVPSSYLEIL